MVYHKVHVRVPRKLRGEVDAKIVERHHDSGNALVVAVSDAMDVSTHEVRVGSVGCENH